MEASFAVLNPGGRDKTQLFPEAAGSPDDAGHPPVNYHAYAACMQSGFYQQAKEVPTTARAVLVLLRKNGLPEAMRAISFLKGRGQRALISWKESGLHQVAEALADVRRYRQFREICQHADAFLSSTPELVSLYRESGCQRGEFLPTPYPVETPAWDFSRPLGEREGIFVGTREFGVPSRNHLLAVSLAASLGVPVTVLNPEGSREERLLRSVSPALRIISGRLAYPDYLRLMAQHRLVLQLDRSAVPGQVAGDALLCRTLCLGGDGAVDRLAYPKAAALPFPEIRHLASRLLADDDFYQDQLNTALRSAEENLSFRAVQAQLERLLEDWK